MVAMIVATLLHVVLCYINFIVFDMGITGLAIASSTKDFVLLAITMLYGYCTPQINEALTPIDSEAFKGWGQYLKVSLPTTVMICSEWWAFEILTIIAGTLGVTQLAS